MKHSIYKLLFPYGVHFGERSLNESGYTFKADTLFSALFIEALKMGLQDVLWNDVKNSKLLFSDAFPYIGETLYLPKPMIRVKIEENKADSVVKKAAKALSYIPMEKISEYIHGELDVVMERENFSLLGKSISRTMAAVYGNEETLPYQVGIYDYHEGNGLYIIVGYESEAEKNLADSLFQALSYSGIGGKRASGLGRFCISEKKEIGSLASGEQWYMSLSIGLPTEMEIEETLQQARYQLLKRSGFILSSDYSDVQRKKRDMYALAAGSCFKRPFSGDIYDVSCGGKHPVYRYAKGLFWKL